MTWQLERTTVFLNQFRAFRKHPLLIEELDKKCRQLQEDPLKVGGTLSHSLKGKRSTRIAKKYRLIFSVDEEQKIVYLLDLDHRKSVYDK